MEAAISINESISEANTLTDPVYSQAISFAPINTVAVVTEAAAAILSKRAFSELVLPFSVETGAAFSVVIVAFYRFLDFRGQGQVI